MKVVFGGKVVALISTCDGRWLFSTEVGSKTNVAGTDTGRKGPSIPVCFKVFIVHFFSLLLL